VDGVEAGHLEPAAGEQVEHLALAEEPQVRGVEHAGGLVAEEPVRQRLDDPAVADVRHTGDDDAVGRQVPRQPLQRWTGLAQVLEHISQHDAVEGRVVQVEVGRLDIGGEHAVEPPSRLGGGLGVDLDPSHLALLPALERHAQPPGAAAHIEHAPGLGRDQLQ